MSLGQYEVIVADTQAARHIHHRLRYEVFCLETGFEDASRFPDQQEKDEFDDNAVPFLVRCRHTGAWLATARLLLPGGKALPITRYCNLNTRTIPLDRMAELSRLLITAHVRRRHPSSRLGRLTPSSRQFAYLCGRRHSIHTASILRELLRAMAAYGVERDIPLAAFFITPALARILARMQIELTVMGSAVHHRGLRVPFLSSAKQVYGSLTRLANSGTGTDARPYRSEAELQRGLDNEKIYYVN